MLSNEARDDFVIKMLHGHGGNVAQFLKHFVSARWFTRTFEDAEDVVNLVDDLARDKATKSGVDVLAKCHGEQVHPGVNGSEYIAVASVGMVPSG